MELKNKNSLTSSKFFGKSINYDYGEYRMIDNIGFTKFVYGEKQFRYANRKHFLPEGFIKYHTNNFKKYFCLDEKDFVNKNILDTGVGPGKHAAVLALMGANVTGLDLSKKNIEKANELKEALNIKNLNFKVFNLMKKLDSSNDYDLISAHNWMQHSENPSRVMSNLVDKLKLNGRFYLSLYQGNTFRFLIAQIAREILDQDDYTTCEKIVRFHFPNGFKQFNNYLDIYLENIFDDFFVPYCNTTSYQIINDDAQKMGLKAITKIPSEKLNYNIDNLALRIGFQKVKEVDYKDSDFSFNKPINEFQANEIRIRDINKLIKLNINYFKNSKSKYEKCSFCLGLYRIRAEVNKSSSLDERFKALKFYLEQSLDKSHWHIASANPIFQEIAK